MDYIVMPSESQGSTPMESPSGVSHSMRSPMAPVCRMPKPSPESHGEICTHKRRQQDERKQG